MMMMMMMMMMMIIIMIVIITTWELILLQSVHSQLDNSIQISVNLSPQTSSLGAFFSTMWEMSSSRPVNSIQFILIKSLSCFGSRYQYIFLIREIWLPSKRVGLENENIGADVGLGSRNHSPGDQVPARPRSGARLCGMFTGQHNCEVLQKRGWWAG